VEHGESGGDAAPRIPDGPPPARERLPLPRRRRQAHLEPQLRTPGGAGSGTPFAAFGSPPSLPPAPAPPPASADRAERADLVERTDRFEIPNRLGRAAASPDRLGRAAAFHAGTRRGRSAGRSRHGTAARRPEQGPPPARTTEF
jgi:hypothetical protein